MRSFQFGDQSKVSPPRHAWLFCFANLRKAAIRAKKVRDKIFDNLSRIPAVLDKAKDFLGMNNSYKSIKLHNAFSSLYSAIVNAFRHMLEWLQKSSFRHAAGAIFKGPDYGKLIDDSVAMVDTQAENVRQHAEICSYYMIGRIDHNITRRECFHDENWSSR